jgi:ribosome-associated protein
MFEVLNQSDKELLESCRVETMRGSGPGGTKSDTTESAVKLTHRPTDISVKASKNRSQHANRKTGLRRLRLKYALQVRHDVKLDRVSVPDQLDSYRNDGIDINPNNPHFPFWVKLVLDVFEASNGQLSTTAGVFDISTNQLVKFLDKHRDVWTKANDIRSNYGHAPMKRD